MEGVGGGGEGLAHPAMAPPFADVASPKTRVYRCFFPFFFLSLFYFTFLSRFCFTYLFISFVFSFSFGLFFFPLLFSQLLLCVSLPPPLSPSESAQISTNCLLFLLLLRPNFSFLLLLLPPPPASLSSLALFRPLLLRFPPHTIPHELVFRYFLIH